MRLLLSALLLLGSWPCAAAQVAAQGVAGMPSSSVQAIVFPAFSQAALPSPAGAGIAPAPAPLRTQSVPAARVKTPAADGAAKVFKKAARAALSGAPSIEEFKRLYQKLEEDFNSGDGSLESGDEEALEKYFHLLYDGLQDENASAVPSPVFIGPSPVRHSPGLAAGAAKDGFDKYAFIKKDGSAKALLGTAAFKVGMETMNISMPLIALTCFHSAVWMATMAVVWGASMSLASMFSGGIIDRRPIQKVIAFALVAEASAVSGIIGLLAAGLGRPLFILPLYAAAGAAMGVVVTCRDCIPARILGRDHGLLSRFNATTHIVYEVAGTLAPLAIGFLIQRFGLTAALLLNPPALALAAAFFFRMKLPPVSAEQGKKAGLAGMFKRVWGDISGGAKLVTSNTQFRWLALMVLAPMVVHRVFEQILVPVFVKTVLHSPEKSAWIIGGSNFGELIGAALLLKTLMGLEKGEKVRRFRWIRWMALGTLAVWSLGLGGKIYFAVPAVFLMSLSWVLNDIHLTSYFQSRLPPEGAGKAVGFLMAAEFGSIVALSYLFGWAFDLLPAKWAFVAVNGLLTVLAALFVRGYYKLKEVSGPNTTGQAAGS
jgi:hypothetical protein